MDELRQSLEWLHEEEGGWSNHKADRGGATMYGVIQATYNSYRTKKGLPAQSVARLTRDEAYDIYKTMYWEPAGCHKLPWPINYMVFDAAVNSGPSRGVKWLQEALGVTADGLVGPGTVKASEAALAKNDGTVLYKIIDRRLVFLANLIKRDPSQGAFLLGWMRRLLRVQLRSAFQLEV